MTIARLQEIGRDLSSRERARVLREEFLRAAAHAHGSEDARLVFDFAGVRTLSDSFADELLAVIVVEKGVAWFRENVSIRNVTPEQRHVILSVVDARLRSRGGDAPDGAPARAS